MERIGHLNIDSSNAFRGTWDGIRCIDEYLNLTLKKGISAHNISNKGIKSYAKQLKVGLPVL